MTRSGSRRLCASGACLLTGLVFLSGCHGGRDAEFDARLATELQRVITRDRAGYELQAVSAAVALPNGAVWAGASGEADTSTGRRAHTETAFAIGSITKTFVSALALELAEDGELDLDDRLAKWVPEFPREKGSSATLRQLLNHTSGIHNFTDDPRFWRALGQEKGTWTPARVLTYVGAPSSSPGDDFAYSNTNYVLLGIVLERASGSTLSELLRDRLLEPLGLERISLQTESPLGNSAHGYTADNHDLPHEDVSDGTAFVPNRAASRAFWASGGMAANARALARWASALYGGRVLEDESLDEMLALRATGEGYEYGLGVIGSRARPGARLLSLGHDGWVPGFRSTMLYLPDEGVALVVLLNDDDTRTLDNISDNLRDVVLGFLEE